MKNDYIFIDVLFDWEVTTKAELFERFALYSYSHGLAKSPDQIMRELRQREEEGSSLIAENFALPHVQSANIQRNGVVFVRLKPPIEEWGGSYESVAGTLFLLLKEGATPQQLQPIKRLMKLLADDQTIDFFLEKDIQEIERALTEGLCNKKE